MIRKFSRRAWHYILAYYCIEHEQESNVTKEMSEINIERVKKQFKTHWSAIDFDEKFINHCFRTTASEVNSGKPEQPKSTV
jgi:tRNA U34 2-thiouridine synthase MnmA/TrmU